MAVQVMSSHFAVDANFRMETTHPIIHKRRVRKISTSGLVVGTDEPAFLLMHQEPFEMTQNLSKGDQELRSVRLFVERFIRMDGKDWHVTPGPGANVSPDVWLVVDHERVGVEVTQVHMPKAVGGSANNTAIARHNMLGKFRKSLLEQPTSLAEELKAHRGFFLQLSFQAPTALADDRLPDKNIGNMVELMKSAKPKFPRGFNPNGMKVVNDYWNEDNTLGVTFEDIPLDPVSPMVRRYGFDVGLVYQQMVTAGQACDELRSVIEGHDDPANQFLIVEVNAPLRSGLYFPSGDDMARLLFDERIGDPLRGWRPTHLQKVVLHDVLALEPRWRWLVGTPGPVS